MSNNSYGVPEPVEATPEQREAAEINQLVEQCLEADLSDEALQKFVEDSGLMRTRIEADLNAKDDLKILARAATSEVPADEQRKAFIDFLDAAKEHLQKTTTIKRESLPFSKMVQQTKREWIIDQWLPANTVTIFSGRGGVGKSRLMLQVVGKSACGWPGNAWENDRARPDVAGKNFDHRGRRVLIASWEDDGIEIGRRLLTAQKALGFMPYERVCQNVNYIDMRGRGPIWGVSENSHLATRGHLLPTGEQVLHGAKEQGARLLVLDPSAAAFGGNENDRASVREYMSYLDAWAYKNKCAVFILAHPPKGDAAYSGSTDWEGSARSMWSLKKLTETKKQEDTKVIVPVMDASGNELYKLSVEKSNYTKQPNPVTLKQDNGVWLDSSSADTQGANNDRSTLTSNVF